MAQTTADSSKSGEISEQHPADLIPATHRGDSDNYVVDLEKTLTGYRDGNKESDSLPKYVGVLYSTHHFPCSFKR